VQNIIMNLVSQIKYNLSQKGWTIAQLGRQSGVPKQTISDWVNGAKPRDISQVKLVADSFGITVDHLCFGSGDPAPFQSINQYEDEINAGIFEVVLRRVKK
jgi:transcriptional regulator with XRE-family HTH domain